MKKILLGLVSLLLPTVLNAQLPNPSTRALGMDGAYTSIAQGYESTFWNPAMLATEGRPKFSISLPHGDLEIGSNIYNFSDFGKYANHYLSDSDKQTLLSKLEPGLPLRIHTEFGVVPFGLSIGQFAMAIGTYGEGNASISNDAMQLLLYGNSTLSNPNQLFTANGSRGNGLVATTAAVSFALPFSLRNNRLSFGITGKYTIGHFLASVEDFGSNINTNPSFHITEAAQAIYTNYSSDCKSINPFSNSDCGGMAGRGISADFGVTLQIPNRDITISAVLVNGLGSMTWNQNRFVYKRTKCQIDYMSSDNFIKTCTDSTKLTTEESINADSQARVFRDSLLHNSNFSRLIRTGFALKKKNLTIGSTMQFRLGKGFDEQPEQLISAGLEYNILGFLPVRIGSSWDFNKTKTFSAGTGLKISRVNVDVSITSISGPSYSGLRLGAGTSLIW
ncbi:MAG: DUF5723 family protein [Candidatus Pacearchaeota archaeon]|jgi:hypothetical protein